MSVDLPSSTDPAVAKRSISAISRSLQRESARARSRRWWLDAGAPQPAMRSESARSARRKPPPQSRRRAPQQPLEVALFLAILHRRLRRPVVAPGGTPFGDPGGGDLVDDLGDGLGARLDGAGVGGV